ncbi:MAG: DUF616 domain-containing protein [bacterium]|nr:DUF616 domain-containing protein [bacterium]
MELEPEQEVHSLVLLGSFNPSIFHPAWYSDNDLLAKEETAEALDLILTREVSTFTVNDIHFQIEQHRFGLTTKDAAKAPFLRDLAIGTFVLLEHTPLTALGLNLELEFALPSVEAWHEVGHRLAPKEPWKTILENPGMRGLVMEGKRPDCDANRIQIRVQPSRSITHGVLVGMNQHYDIKTESRESVRECNAEVIRILNNEGQSLRSFLLKASDTLVHPTQQED